MSGDSKTIFRSEKRMNLSDGNDYLSVVEISKESSFLVHKEMVEKNEEGVVTKITEQFTPLSENDEEFKYLLDFLSDNFIDKTPEEHEVIMKALSRILIIEGTVVDGLFSIWPIYVILFVEDNSKSLESLRKIHGRLPPMKWRRKKRSQLISMFSVSLDNYLIEGDVKQSA